MSEPDRINRLASRLARDRPVDWDAQERMAANDTERGAIRQLRALAAVAGFYRSVQAGDASTDLSRSVSIGQGVANPANRDARATSVAELAPGSRWGHLEIEARIGSGAFGTVYRARDTRLDRIVALKLLEREALASSDEVVREAGLLARVRHPNVVTVFGADRSDGRVGIWMEFLRGETLDGILRERGPLDAREAALVGIDLCRALSAVHAAGIIHQDVKLGNVMRAEGGRIVLMDFGLGLEGRTSNRSGGPDKIVGTPLFMAPELLHGSAADVRSDIYSLGVVLFALVTGTMPVEASSLSDLLAKHTAGEIRRPRDLRPDIPEAFAHVLDRALAPEPKHRFATAGEAERALLLSLGTFIQPQSARGRASNVQRLALLVLGGALLVAVGIGIRGRLRPTAAAEKPRTAPLTEAPSATLFGEEAKDLFGLALAGVGDVDQDGFDDVLVGAPQFGEDDRGKIYLYRGTPRGIEPRPFWSAVGTGAKAYFGWSIAASTNLQQDGFADLVVGAPSPGHVFVYRGSKSGPSQRPVQRLDSNRPGTIFGFAIATGDVNHDGLDDLLVGEPQWPSEPIQNGRAYLYLSDGDTLMTRPVWTATGPAGSMFGMAVSLGGDINHDGYLDAVIGAPKASFGPDRSSCGAAYVFLGSATGLDSIPTELPGRYAGARFGVGAEIIEDLDADGFSDVLLGAELGSNGEQDEGIVEIYFGTRNGIAPYGEILLESNTMGANFGGHTGTLGDLDGDGCDDLFIGALRYQRTEPREGAAFVFRGARDRRLSRAWMHVPDKPGSWYGAAGGSAGDVNGDGFGDFIVAAPSWDTDAGTNVGKVELFLNTRKR